MQKIIFASFLFLFLRSVGFAANVNPDQAIKIDEKQVSFGGVGNFIIDQDDHKLTYSQPQWQDNSSPLNRSAEDAGDKKYPVGYKIDSTPVIGAVFWAEVDFPSGTTAVAKATGTAGLNIPETTCSIAGKIITMPNTSTTNPLPNSVQYYDTFNFQWQVKINNGKFKDVGTSKNRLFVTLDIPKQSPDFYTVVYQACRNAIGTTNLTAAIPKVWAVFSGPANTKKVQDPHPDLIKIENGNPLHYYNPWLDVPNNPIAGWPGFGIEDLLRSENGQCTSWAEFWVQCLNTHGFSEKAYIRVTPDQAYEFFLVKNWTFLGPGSNTNEYANVFGLRWVNLQGLPSFSGNHYVWSSFEVIDFNGIPGQNSLNPQSFFSWHSITRIQGKYYDPSYGLTYVGSVNMTNSASDGFAIEQQWFDPGTNSTVAASLIRKTLMGKDIFPASLVFSGTQGTP